MYVEAQGPCNLSSSLTDLVWRLKEAPPVLIGLCEKGNVEGRL